MSADIIPALPEKFGRDEAGDVRRIGDRFNDYIANERRGGVPQWLIDEYGYHSQSKPYDRTLADGEIVQGYDFTRPGKTVEEGKSLTLLGSHSIWVWSTTNLSQALRDRISDTTDRDGRYFDPFGFFVFQSHDGDFSAATAAILEDHPDWRPQGVVIPHGYRLWQDGDDERHPPQLDDAALYGVVGDWLRLVDDQTEATLAALGIGLITVVGAVLGRNVHFSITRTTHFPIVNSVIVGPTSQARKGDADQLVWSLVDRIDPIFKVENTAGGFASGEMLV